MNEIKVIEEYLKSRFEETVNHYINTNWFIHDSGVIVSPSNGLMYWAILIKDD